MSSNTPRPSKNERQASAREKAAKLAATQAAQEKRKSLMVKLGVIGAVIVVIALVIVLIFQNQNNEVADAGTAPKGGNAAGGITLISDTEVADTSGVSVDINKVGEPKNVAAPEPRDLNIGAKGEPVKLTIFADANCVHCATFEADYGDQIGQWLANGDVVAEYRTVGFLDGGSPTNYSSRAANAMACVADAAPASYLNFIEAVWANHANGEMKNAELAQLAENNGADVSDCINDGTFRSFVQFTTAAAEVDGVRATPTVMIQDQEFTLGGDFVAEVEAAIAANA